MRRLNRNKQGKILLNGARVDQDRRSSHMMRVTFVVASLALASPCFAQQVRVISGDIQHVYGPGGQLLDDANLQAQNQRAWERMQAEKQLEIEKRRVDLEMERLKLQGSSLAYAPYTISYGYGDWWDGVGFIGPGRGAFHRRMIGRSVGVSHRMGGSPGMGIGGSHR
jgi:hypothetical protein